MESIDLQKINFFFKHFRSTGHLMVSLALFHSRESVLNIFPNSEKNCKHYGFFYIHMGMHFSKGIVTDKGLQLTDCNRKGR